VDDRLVDELLSYGKAGRIIDRESEAGGHPRQLMSAPPVDTDGDGISDEWELAHHLDPHDAKDGQQLNPATGYTYLETYLNELAAQSAKVCGAR
jgi:Bacterial TSP3 repeat